MVLAAAAPARCIPWEEVFRLCLAAAHRVWPGSPPARFDHQDLAQSALVGLLRRSEATGEGLAMDPKFISVIACRRAIDTIRQATARKVHTRARVGVMPSLEEMDGGMGAQRFVPAWGAVGATEDVIALIDTEALLARIRPADVQVVLLTAQGFSQREIAERMGVTESRISQRLTRARADLRALAGRGNEEC